MNRNQTIELSIPKPCSQDWEGMSVNEKGRFCDSCNKSVIDFTNYNDQQLAAFFEKNPGKVCGKLRKDQLGKTLHEVHYTPNYSISQFLVTAALVIGSGNGAYAKEKSITTSVIHVAQDAAKEEKENKLATGDSARCISGTVIDGGTKETVPGVAVILEETNLAVSTDINGFFKLNIPANLLADTIKIKVVGIGYETQTLTFAPGVVALSQIIEIRFTAAALGGIQGSVLYASRWQQLKWRFRKMIKHV